MSDHKAQHAHGDHDHSRTYWLVFIALIIGTIVTVGAYFIHFETIVMTIGLALLIASVKASLVAGWFMHLASEKRMIYTILAFTGFFFLGMMLLTIWAMHDAPPPIFP
ncbi:MAG: cytochrome C oxidase subunit IV family protein [Limisphaerales bacterium]